VTDSSGETRGFPGIDRIEGRKAFVTATLIDADDTVLSESSGLMIKLLPHQP
jgi:hypothetical protein